MSVKSKSFIIVIAMLAVVAALLGFTRPGHRVLYSVGACNTSDC
jgi:hypothetical protein